jgi:hypothetical protein
MPVLYSWLNDQFHAEQIHHFQEQILQSGPPIFPSCIREHYFAFDHDHYHVLIRRKDRNAKIKLKDIDHADGVAGQFHFT